MVPLGVSRNKLARDIDVPVGRISDIVNGKRGVTPDTALRLARYFGTDAELWMRLQWEYDLFVARSTTWPNIEPRVRVFDPSDVVVPEEEERDDALSAAEPASPPPTVEDNDTDEVSVSESESQPGPNSIDDEPGAQSAEIEDFDPTEGEPPETMTTERGMAAIAAAIEAEMDAMETDSVEESSADDRIAGMSIVSVEPDTNERGDREPPEYGDLSDSGTAQDEDPDTAPSVTDPPLVLVDPVDPEHAEDSPEPSDTTSAQSEEDDELGSLDIPDPDRLRFRVTTE
jgi:addiction module HigA family antidote